MTAVSRNINGEIFFEDHPEFTPNLSPREIFELGSFGGTYWRPIYSSVTGENYENRHLKFNWSKEIPSSRLTKSWDQYDVKCNKYRVKVGQTLEEWEAKDWISEIDPYGWTEWYSNFYEGRRTGDDDRQIRRWQSTASPNSRFAKWLVRQIVEKDATWDDYSVSPKIRQTLQHWGYALNKQDFDRIRNEMGYL